MGATGNHLGIVKDVTKNPRAVSGEPEIPACLGACQKLSGPSRMRLDRCPIWWRVNSAPPAHKFWTTTSRHSNPLAEGVAGRQAALGQSSHFLRGANAGTAHRSGDIGREDGTPTRGWWSSDATRASSDNQDAPPLVGGRIVVVERVLSLG